MLSLTSGSILLLIVSGCCIHHSAAVHVAFDNDLAVQGIKSALYHPGPLGNHAGLLGAAKAISQLDYAKAAAAAAQDAHIEAHDFSETSSDHGYAADASQHDALGALGDHLQEGHFPGDYGVDHGASASAYEEVDAGVEGAATEQHGAYVQASGKLDVGGESHLQNFDYHGSDYQDDYHSQAVLGIDHGKGAFSYSTLYEHKHDGHEVDS